MLQVAYNYYYYYYYLCPVYLATGNTTNRKYLTVSLFKNSFIKDTKMFEWTGGK